MRSKSPSYFAPRFPSWRSRHGTALVLVLWIMVVLSAVALQLSYSSHLRLQVTASIGQSTAALYLARAGVERAVADLVENRNSVQALADLRESDTVEYCNVELGNGTYTLLAALDESGDPVCGIMDEAAKINVNIADADVLRKLPGMNSELVSAIMALKQRGEIHDVNDLLLVEQVNVQLLFGEDANGNGLLDANEDDGGKSWPPDNADGSLDSGLVGYLTTWSATRQINTSGERRVDINSADAKKLQQAISGLTTQEAESIVEHRKKNKFASIANLLDVELVKKNVL